MRSRTIAFKLVVFTLSGTMAIFVSAFACVYFSSKASMMRYVEMNARNATHAAAYQIESVLRGIEKVPLNYAALLTSGDCKPAALAMLPEQMVSTNPEIFGAAIAFEPGASGPGSLYYAPYCYRGKNGGLKNVMLGNESYDYFTMDWYQIPEQLGRAAWTEPYYDEGGGNETMATFSVPFYKVLQGKNKFQGVVTADVALRGLKQIVSSTRLNKSGYSFLITRNGVFVTSPDSTLIMTNSIFSVAEEKHSALLRRIGRKMIAGGEGFAALPKGLLYPGKCWLYYTPLPSIGWSIGIVTPEGVMLADVLRFSRMVILIGLLGVCLMALIVMLIAKRISKPIKDLSATTLEIARGNLNATLPDIHRGDEIGALARSFEDMRVALKDYIENLTQTTAAKERIESELKIAGRIQMSFLPKAFPPLPGKTPVDIAARLEPARQIGGDLYDYFLLDDDHLFFTVGDVSDKGIPAALFMAVTKTLLKGIAEKGMSPSEILDKCNLELIGGNDSMMFVTLFCAILDLRSGRLRYSNAGHEHPFILRREGPLETLPIPEGFVLGVNEDAGYQTMEVELKPGDRLIVYTDGVTEAVNGAGEFYAHQNLISVLESCGSLCAEGIVSRILDSVKTFSSGVPQADDITLLAVSLTGPKL
ncbi:MAG: SpoIIE family protein phosphatase [Syntrophobacteraceae bacterium]|nr:SpoIIE family protein phosphatase [Syntrophobacteraceae bacterium]